MVIPAALMACSNLAVPATVMQHVAMVESAGHPYAIGVVGARLLRQPATLAEAVATARQLEAQGYNFSLGVAQVNRANLERYGLDTYEKAFSLCDNLVAGSAILAECHARHHGAWTKALSCYYSGNAETGVRDGYVQKVLASIGTSMPAAETTADPMAAHASSADAPAGDALTLLSAPAPVVHPSAPAARTAGPRQRGVAAPVRLAREPAVPDQNRRAQAFQPRVLLPAAAVRAPGPGERSDTESTGTPAAAPAAEVDAAFVF